MFDWLTDWLIDWINIMSEWLTNWLTYWLTDSMTDGFREINLARESPVQVRVLTGAGDRQLHWVLLTESSLGNERHLEIIWSY